MIISYSVDYELKPSGAKSGSMVAISLSLVQESHERVKKRGIAVEGEDN